MIGQSYANELSTKMVQTLLVFSLEGQSYALGIEHVAQIIPMLKLTPVPQVEHMIEGVANIHGTVVPVIAARRHLGLPDIMPGLYTPIILTHVADRTIGLIVDEVTDVITTPAENLVSPDEILPDGTNNSPVIHGVVYQGDRSVLVLDPHFLLRPSQVRTLSRALQNAPAILYPPAPRVEIEAEPCDPPAVPFNPVLPVSTKPANGGQSGTAKKPQPAPYTADNTPTRPAVPGTPIIENLSAFQDAVKSFQPPKPVESETPPAANVPAIKNTPPADEPPASEETVTKYTYLPPITPANQTPLSAPPSAVQPPAASDETAQAENQAKPAAKKTGASKKKGAKK